MTKVKIISDPAEYFDLLSSDQIKVTDANFINDELIEVHFENVDEFVEADGKTNVVIAAFTMHSTRSPKTLQCPRTARSSSLVL